MNRRWATAMGSGGLVARRLGSLLWCRALSPGAGPAAGAGPRLGLLAAGWHKAGQALDRACLTPDHARGLHGGPGLEEWAQGAAGEGQPESSTAGTGLEEGGGDPSGQPGVGSQRGGSEFPRLCINLGVTKLLLL